MKLSRVLTLLGKDVLHGPRGFILTMIVGAPILITLVVNLVLGNLLDDSPVLAVADEGDSLLVSLLRDTPQIRVIEHVSPKDLRDAVSRGAADSGIILPAGFDETITSGETVRVTVYFWGESLASDRLIIASTLLDTADELSGRAEPVTLETVVPEGDAEIPWNQRLLPLTVLIAVFFGGLMLPATSLIEEKQKRTLQALSVTPVNYTEIFVAKAILAVILSLVMAGIILLINQGWGNQPFILALVLLLGAVMAAEIGLILGTLIKDMNTLFAIWKFGGLILFGPAIIYMFPGLPQWLNYFFPTYYVTGPIMDINFGSVTAETWIQLGVAAAIIIALAFVQTKVMPFLTGEASSRRAGVFLKRGRVN